MANSIKHKFFTAVYTNEVKDYCDIQFFENLYLITGDAPVYVADNTIGTGYHNKLKKHFLERRYDNFRIDHLDIEEHPKQSQFQRNVFESVNFIRNIYLNNYNSPYFLIIESDVIPPRGLFEQFECAISELDRSEPAWGIVGAMYYRGFHNYDFDTRGKFLERTHHCLAGCTVYKRELIRKYPFRFDPENLGPFPDAFICYDAGSEFSFWNDHRIKCDHLHINGARMSRSL